MVAAVTAAATINAYRPLARNGFASLWSWFIGLVVTEFPLPTLASQLGGLVLTAQRLTRPVRAVSWLVAAFSALGLLNLSRAGRQADAQLTAALDSGFGGGFGGFGVGGDGAEFNLNDLFDAASRTGGTTIGDLFGGLFGRGGSARPSRPRRGNDLETETELDFVEAAKGVAMPLRLTSPAPCTNCHGSGARPGTSPKVCPTCNGSGVINRNQGAFGFSEPCTDCRGSGSIIEHPCEECKGTGVTTRTRTINVRIPPGVEDGQRIRLAGQGEAGLRGAPSGDLYVTVHVRPDKIFGRDGDDLTVTVPVSFTELALGSTLSVPTLDGTVGVRVPKGTADGRILRVRGRGVPKRSGGSGDLLVTVKVAVPPNLAGAAQEALEAYAAAERSSGFNPRAGWAGNR